jgi:DNA-binding NarL/FixJ family response regulator
LALEALVVSERRLFRITFTKLLQVVNASMTVMEHGADAQSVTSLPAASNGIVVVDAGKASIDSIISDVLSLLAIEPEAHILVVFDEADDSCVEAAMQTGAIGVAVKSSPPQVLIDTLQRVVEGERCRPAPMLTLSREDIPVEIREQLSARQQKLLRAIMGGQSISATAKALGLTPAKVVHEMRQVLGAMRGRPF